MSPVRNPSGQHHSIFPPPALCFYLRPKPLNLRHEKNPGIHNHCHADHRDDPRRDVHSRQRNGVRHSHPLPRATRRCRRGGDNPRCRPPPRHHLACHSSRRPHLPPRRPRRSRSSSCLIKTLPLQPPPQNTKTAWTISGASAPRPKRVAVPNVASVNTKLASSPRASASTSSSTKALLKSSTSSSVIAASIS